MGNANGKSPSTLSSLSKASRASWRSGVPSPPGRPSVELTNRSIITKEDSVTDEIDIFWNVPEDDGGYPITGYRVEMMDISSGTWIEITHIESYEPKCTLSNILYGIMYTFRVIAVNDSGSSEPGFPSEPVVIDVPGVQIAPYFVVSLQDILALENNTIEFRVRVLGTPKPTLQWFKDDLLISESERLELIIEDEGALLVLKEARLSDSGLLKCIASNILGKAISTTQLTVECAPKLEVPDSLSEGLIFRLEEMIRLKVNMVAKPNAQVTWFFEDEPITQGSDLLIESTETFTSLKIQGAKRWHCGEFKVYAENDHGEDAVSILVTITSPPSAPSRPIVIDITETRCTLRWEMPEDDGGSNIKHYIIEYFRDLWDVWLKAQTTKDTKVVIEDLIPGSRYSFRIKAENDFGVSEASMESDPFDVGGVSSSEKHLEENYYSETSLLTQKDENEKENLSQKRLRLPSTRWGSISTEDEDILERFLKVQRFAENEVSSYDSDGLPSIASIDDEMDNLGEEIFRTRKQLLDEYKQLSFEKDEMTSIPDDKMEELNNFEKSLQEMIDEAKSMTKQIEREEITIDETQEEFQGEKYKDSILESDEMMKNVSQQVIFESSKDISRKTNEEEESKEFSSSSFGKASQLPTPKISVTIPNEENFNDPSGPLKELQKQILAQHLELQQRNSSKNPWFGIDRYEELMTRKASNVSALSTQSSEKEVDCYQKQIRQPIVPSRDSSFTPGVIQVSLEPLKNLEKQRRIVPSWLILCVTYSCVLIAIILLSNRMTEPKLFIHFTAFWTCLLYFTLDENDYILDPIVKDLLLKKEEDTNGIFLLSSSNDDSNTRIFLWTL